MDTFQQDYTALLWVWSTVANRRDGATNQLVRSKITALNFDLHLSGSNPLVQRVFPKDEDDLGNSLLPSTDI